MASRTQIRLQQITGSFGNATGKIRDDIAKSGASLNSIVTADLSGSLGIIASAVKRINGGSAFSSQDASKLADASGNNRIDYTNGQGVTIKSEDGSADVVTFGTSVAGNQGSRFAGAITIPDAGTIGSVSAVSAISIAASGDVTLSEDLRFANGKEIGSAGTSDLVTVNANDIQIKTGKTLKTDLIAESANAAGVTIDGVLIKDNDIVVPDGSTIGSTTSPTAISIAGDGIVTFVDDIKIKDTGTIGSATTPAAITIAANGNITTSGGLIVGGGLDVNGTTTTIDTVNLQVEDSIIGLGISGSDGTFDDVGDRAIIFCRSAAQTDALAALNYKRTGAGTGRFELAKYLASPTSASMGAASEFSDLKVNNLELAGGLALPDSAGDHTLTLEANGDDLSADRTLDFIVADSGGTDANRTLHIEANTVKLDQDYTVDASVQFAGLNLSEGNITNVGDINADSLSVDDATVGLNIDGSGANNGLFKISLKDDVANALEITEGGQAFLKFVTTDGGAADQNQKVELGRQLDLNGNSLIIDADGDSGISASGDDIITFTIGTNDQLHLSASVLSPNLDNALALGRSSHGYSDLFLGNGAVLNFKNGDVTLTHDTAKLTLLADKDLKFGSDAMGISNGSGNRLELTSNSNAFLFPNAFAGASGQAIVGDGAGSLSFAEVGAPTAKGVFVMTASHAATVAFKLTSNGNRQSTSDSITLADVTDSQGKKLDVFVNGQLLISGSQSLVGAGSADYMLDDTQNIAFGFALENEDIVQVLYRN